MTPVLADFLWLNDSSFLYYALLLWFIFAVVDWLSDTDFLSWVLLLAVAGWLTWLCCSSVLWGIIFFLFALVVLVTLHVIARNYMHKLLNKILTRNTPKEYVDSMCGKTGVIVGIGDNACVRVEEVLYPLDLRGRAEFEEGESVLFAGFESGLAVCGKPGVIHVTEDNVNVEVEGMSYPLTTSKRSPYREGDKVIFITCKDGVAVVQKM